MPRKTTDWITKYLEYTDNSEPPRLYREWIAVSVIAAVLQRKCFLRWGELTFYPNMYVVLVGPSGRSRKGTAMSVGASFLREIGINMAAEAITREALIRELSEATDMFQMPSGDLYTHASLTIYSQELTVFLGYNNLQLISDITDWYDCREYWTYRTKNMGTDEIIGVWVNLIGATTPSLIQNALPADAIGGGLASRIIFVYEENKGKVVAAPFISTADVQLRKDLKHDLEDIYTTRGMFRVSDPFVEAWVKWYEHQEDNPPFTDANFSGYVSRRPNHILKLCMILAASENSLSSDGDPILTETILARAIDLLERTEIKMPRVFMGFGASDMSAITSKIMAYIANRKSLTSNDIMRSFYADLGSTKALDDILYVLKDIGFIQETHTSSGKIMINYIPNNSFSKQFGP
jgi:hypothetical protein